MWTERTVGVATAVDQYLRHAKHVHSFAAARVVLGGIFVVGVTVDGDLRVRTRASGQQQLHDLELGVSHRAVQGGGVALQVTLHLQVRPRVDEQQSEAGVACAASMKQGWRGRG